MEGQRYLYEKYKNKYEIRGKRISSFRKVFDKREGKCSHKNDNGIRVVVLYSKKSVKYNLLILFNNYREDSHSWVNKEGTKSRLKDLSQKI